MLDKDRILSKIDELEGYVSELRGIMPKSLPDYERSAEKRRACERLLQISVECVIDICNLMVIGLKLGLPSNESDILDKLEKNKAISGKVSGRIRKMKSFRNILVHRYGHTDDSMVFALLKNRLGDFDEFMDEIVKYVKNRRK
jgi:uncharacterized protein YutE (UPF0331/DUF86 family)